MNQKNRLILLFVLFLFNACIKDTKVYTIKGILSQNCNHTPIAGEALELWQQREVGNQKATLATTTTDGNGYFTFSYKVDNDNYPLTIRNAGGYTYMERIPQRQNLQNLVVYQAPTTSIKLSLNVQNAYTSSDTLYITDFRIYTTEKLKIAGPFTSGELYTAPTFDLLNQYYDPTTLTLGYKINNGSWILKDFGFKACEAKEIAVDIQ